MALQKKNNIAAQFPVVVIAFTALLGVFIYVLHLFNLVTPANEVYARFCALALFIVGFVLLGLQEAKNHKLSWDDIYKNNTLIIISLTFVLVSFFLTKRVSYYAIGLFAAASLLHLLYTRKFYVPPTFVYFIFAYALLILFGTIGTLRGFHIPNHVDNFFVFPLAFCCFSLSKKALLKIGKLFFRAGIIFLAISVLYWFYNFLHLDADFIEWIIGKSIYLTQMVGWETQATTHNYWLDNVVTKDTVIPYSAYFFVDSWTYSYHPSTNIITLLGGVIVGFYLYGKKDEFFTISKWELLLYAVLCLLTIMLLQSRIGFIGFFLIVFITGFYFLKLRIKRFKIALLAYLLLSGASLVVLDSKISSFVNDDIRDAYRRIAVSYIQEHFWWGSGFNQQQVVLEQQAEKMKDLLPETVYPHKNLPITHVHNQFLGNMVQFGVWGLIVLVAMLVAIAYYAIKNRNYSLQTFLCFVLFFMLIEEGEYMKILAFITFFAAISESEKEDRQFIYLKK